MKSRKHTITGWTSKSAPLNRLLVWKPLGNFQRLIDGSSGIYSTRGNKLAWTSADWPPKRVRITVEELP